MSDMVGNPDDQFSRVAAHTMTHLCFVIKSPVYSLSGAIALTLFSILVYISIWSLVPLLVSLWYSSKKSLLKIHQDKNYLLSENYLQISPSRHMTSE